MQPCVAVGVLLQSLGVLFRMTDVAEHHRWAGEADFALFAVRHFFLGSGLADLEISVRERDADGTFLLLVVGGKTACRDALGGAVAFAYANTGVMLFKEGVELLLELDGERVAT